MKTTKNKAFPEWKAFLNEEGVRVTRSVVKRSGEIEAYNPKKINRQLIKPLKPQQVCLMMIKQTV